MANQPYRQSRPGCPGQSRPGYVPGRPVPYAHRPAPHRHPCDHDCHDDKHGHDDHCHDDDRCYANDHCHDDDHLHDDDHRCIDCSSNSMACPAMNTMFDPKMFPIGMAYVPMQSWGPLYDHRKALAQGTLFPELDKPFIGRRACR